MKKVLVIILAVTMVAGLVGCKAVTDPSKDGKFQIVTTIFPEYDWVKQILGDNPAKAELTLLLDKGVDLHSYQPTADDIMKISTCDLFIYVGGESDGWVQKALKEAKNKNMVVINLLEVLGDSVKEEELVEGMQEEEHDNDHGDEDHDDDHDGEHKDDHDDDHEHGETEYDEHVWLSLRNTMKLVDIISKGMQKADADNATTYEDNAKAYIEKLKALDAEYEKAVKEATVKTLLFGDRFPFRYLTDDYGLQYFAAFAGCSAESEASFETITFLSKKVDELGLNSVITIEGQNHKIAETIVQNTKGKSQKILILDSLQSKTANDVKNGTTYLSVMEKNLSVIKEALK